MLRMSEDGGYITDNITKIIYVCEHILVMCYTRYLTQLIDVHGIQMYNVLPSYNSSQNLILCPEIW